MAKDDWVVEHGVTLVPELSKISSTFWSCRLAFVLIGSLAGFVIVRVQVVNERIVEGQILDQRLSRDVLTLQQDYQQLRDDLDSHDLNASVHGGAAPGLLQSRVNAAILRAAEKLWHKPFDPPPGTVGQMLRAVETSEQE